MNSKNKSKFIKLTKLKQVRENEGWPLNELARAAQISTATLGKAESGDRVRPYIWGKILKGVNSMLNKSRVYILSDINDVS